MNSVQILGNLGRDPVIRATKTGRAMASFSVAVSRTFTNPQGEQREITDWINVVAWGNLAEQVGNSLHKGSRVFVEGRFTTRSYDTPDGQRRWVSEVTANVIAIPLQGSHGGEPAGTSFGGQRSGGYNNSGYNRGGYNSGNSGFNQGGSGANGGYSGYNRGGYNNGNAGFGQGPAANGAQGHGGEQPAGNADTTPSQPKPKFGKFGDASTDEDIPF